MILIGLGANLPCADGTTPALSLRRAVNALKENRIFVTKASHIWKSSPVPISNQPWYCNAVCAVETSLSSDNLLKTLNNIEEETGRVRGRRNEARVLDLDILTYNNEIINEEHLQIPHPRMHERSFVLMPLQEITEEIAPDWRHPTLKKGIEEMIQCLDLTQKIEKTETGLC